MGFNSVAFAIFLPLVFAVYWAMARGPLRRQNLFVLLASYVFYGWWDWRFLGLIWISSATDYWVARAIRGSRGSRRKKRLLLVSIGVNLGILGLFKYFDFFAGSLADLLAVVGMQLDAVTLEVVLPVGISFYTFQTLSYTIDVYRGRIEPSTDWVAFFSFVAFFPQLVAGPIERAGNLLPQFLCRRVFSHDRAVSGLRLILWGLFKKLVVADRLAPFVDLVFGPEASPSALMVAVGSCAFSFQVYCDFSGYSDIAIGTARLFGFNLMTNFRAPFFSASMTDMWRRWHISLSTWFRDYVYHPLGGNRVSMGRSIFNILLTFAAAGLWHGAGLNFVAWGLFLGVALSVERLAAGLLGERLKVPNVLAVMATFATFSMSALIFRSRDLAHAGSMIQRLFTGGGTDTLAQAVDTVFGSRLEVGYILLSIVLLMLVDFVSQKRDWSSWFVSAPRTLRWAIYYAVVVWTLFFGEFSTAPDFVYFQF
jgi:D-alanyl-lipoteichoic acid acyltransferase DltB (MBOAT superfamily)